MPLSDSTGSSWDGFTQVQSFLLDLNHQLLLQPVLRDNVWDKNCQ